ncbi:DNA polymerase III beta subunit-like protein [Actinocorallia herbida]|uniref:DNA polymerase III beta subunit-like protein n=1 Tax=Actinocorallia herbida TaxID=58109 RepID=A0A3N1CMP7_9ACTN|nr:hypothetical protein [Actinocorallia herbida]ROO82596.1 DNA polymerase III beta subunit-like protein [Actinocorallia herbida]
MPTALALALTVPSAEFAAAIGRAARFLPDPDARGIYAMRGMLLTATADGVEVMATHGQETARIALDADVEAPGRVLVNGLMLARISRNLPSDPVLLSEGARGLGISCGSITYRLATLPLEDYPVGLEATSDGTGVRPAGRDGWERAMSTPSASSTLWRAPGRSRKPFDPSGLEVGAAVIWSRHADDGSLVSVSGQVWSAAEGRRTVWVVADGERVAVKVAERTYGEGSYRDGTYRQVTRLVEVE